MQRPGANQGKAGSDTANRWFEAARHHWLQDHYGADQVVDDVSRIMVKGDGIHLFDIEGKKYIDTIAGLFLMNIGHGRTEVADAVAAQLKELAYVNSVLFHKYTRGSIYTIGPALHRASTTVI